MMAIHYNAFISYRHHPDDIRIAAEIHRSLERFKVPRAIRKRNGTISRLFRDKEELPISSNLNDDIATALLNADFLIVICSEHTKESVWVQREIEFFLKTHSRNKILTVLAGGDPYDVIPEILLYEDVLDEKTGEIRRRQVEPLSCDWRMKHRKAKQEELPRLAAVLLGCGYDELRQRQKQYRIRRAMAAISVCLAVSIGFAAYFLHTSIKIQKANVQIQQANEEIKQANEEIRQANVQIQENLDEAQRNQSRHLATAARERLEAGDRLTAISLAMAALPSEGNERPYIPQAEDILSEALGVYNTMPELVAIGAVGSGTNVGIKKFWVSEEQNVLYLYDARNIVSAWDCQSLQMLGTIDLGEVRLDKLFITSEGNAVIAEGYGNLLRCFRPDGTCLWQLEKCYDTAIFSDKSALLVITPDQKLLFLDPDSGENTREPQELGTLEGGQNPRNFYLDTYRKESPIAIRYWGYEDKFFCLWDTQTMTCRTVPTQIVYPERIVITDDGKLVIMGTGESDTMMGYIDGNRMTAPLRNRLYCYDMASLNFLWESEITAYSYIGCLTLEQIPGREQVLCQSGNTFQILDLNTGEITARCEAANSVVSVTVEENAAIAALQDGFICRYNYDANYCYEYKCMESVVESAILAEGFYSLQKEGTQVTVYRNLGVNADWEYSFDEYVSVDKRKTHGRYMVFQYSGKAYLFDMDSKQLKWKTDGKQGELLDFSADGQKLWFIKDRSSLVAIETESGKIAPGVELPAGEASGFFMAENCLHYLVFKGNSQRMTVLDLNTGAIQTIDLTEDEENTLGYLNILAREKQYLWVYANAGVLLEINLETETVQTVAEGLQKCPAIALQEDGSAIAVADLDRIYIKTPGKSDVSQFGLDTVKTGSVCFFGDALLALCDNGILYRFDLQGNCLSQTELVVGNNYFSNITSHSADPDMFSWYFTKDNHLLLNADEVCNVIDCESWNRSAWVSDCVMFREENNSFVCVKNGELFGIRRYTTEELLQIGRQALGDFALTQEQKAAYGIQ